MIIILTKDDRVKAPIREPIWASFSYRAREAYKSAELSDCGGIDEP